MNAPRDAWDDFAEVFAAELATRGCWTPEAMEAAREQYERAQIASAQSERDFDANVKEYSK